MWTVIYIAPTVTVAEKIRDRLGDEGFEIRMRPIMMGKNPQFEISVRDSEIHDVQELLMQILND